MRQASLTRRVPELLRSECRARDMLRAAAMRYIAGDAHQAIDAFVI